MEHNKDNSIDKSTLKNVFGTKEWAEQNFNFIDGCIHNCKYCYSKEMAIRFGRKTSDNWNDEKIRTKDFVKTFKKYNGKIMFPSSHDIHPKHLNETLIILQKILSAGNEILIVTKPHLECIKAICDKFNQFKDKILFRFTIGSLDSEILKFWEPGAPSFEERFDCLKFAYKNGFQTSVSCEPLLDFNPDKLIDKILPLITNSIWIGKANFLLKRMRTNGITDENSIQKALELADWQARTENITTLFEKYKSNKKIKWKESIKKVVKIDIPQIKGLDI